MSTIDLERVSTGLNLRCVPAPEPYVSDFPQLVDFIQNAAQWVDQYLPSSFEHSLYISATADNDSLFGDSVYLREKHQDGQIFSYGGDDLLESGLGTDYLLGASGADRYRWRSGDGHDYTGDYDYDYDEDAGDRIIVDYIDLANLKFKRRSTNSPYYVDPNQPGITLHCDGGQQQRGVRQRDASQCLFVSEGNRVKWAPGMAAKAEIKTGKRRLMEFFLSPLLRYRQESVRER